MSNIEIGRLQDNYFHIGSTGKTEPTDTYFFSLPTMGSTRISAVGSSGDINMELQDKEGRLIKSISTSDENTGILSTDNLGVAGYILNVSPVSGNTNYQVSLTPDGKVDPLTGMGLEAGFFTTDQKGEVGFDLLHDGGRYKGEVAIFSLDGMEELTSEWPSRGMGRRWPGRYEGQPLPLITDSVIIDGTTLAELSDRPVIKLDGSNVSLDNLYISAGNSTVR